MCPIVSEDGRRNGSTVSQTPGVVPKKSAPLSSDGPGVQGALNPWLCAVASSWPQATSKNNTEVARELGIERGTVRKRRDRLVEMRLDGLHDYPRPGAPRTVTDDAVELVSVKTIEETPAATHWYTLAGYCERISDSGH